MLLLHNIYLKATTSPCLLRLLPHHRFASCEESSCHNPVSAGKWKIRRTCHHHHSSLGFPFLSRSPRSLLAPRCDEKARDRVSFNIIFPRRNHNHEENKKRICEKCEICLNSNTKCGKYFLHPDPSPGEIRFSDAFSGHPFGWV